MDCPLYAGDLDEVLEDGGSPDDYTDLGRVCKVYITPTHKIVATISHMALKLAARFS
jgi:hypothetical protein